VNDELTLQLIKAGHRAHQHAVGELAPHTFIGNDMRHKSFFFQVDRASKRKLDERREFRQFAFGKMPGRRGQQREEMGLEVRGQRSDVRCQMSDVRD
jgi:hypothetical protein